MADVALIVKALRGARGLSQDELAERAGIERIEISKIENGRNKASSFRVRTALAGGLDMPVGLLSDALDGRISWAEALSTSAMPARAGAPDPAAPAPVAAPARIVDREDLPYVVGEFIERMQDDGATEKQVASFRARLPAYKGEPPTYDELAEVWRKMLRDRDALEAAVAKIKAPAQPVAGSEDDPFGKPAAKTPRRGAR